MDTGITFSMSIVCKLIAAVLVLLKKRHFSSDFFLLNKKGHFSHPDRVC